MWYKTNKNPPLQNEIKNRKRKLFPDRTGMTFTPAQGINFLPRLESVLIHWNDASKFSTVDKYLKLCISIWFCRRKLSGSYVSVSKSTLVSGSLNFTNVTIYVQLKNPARENYISLHPSWTRQENGVVDYYLILGVLLNRNEFIAEWKS